MTDAVYLGVVRNGESLLTTFAIDKNNDRSARAAQREAEKCLHGWAQVFPSDCLSIEPLSSRGRNGWEIAKK